MDLNTNSKGMLTWLALASVVNYVVLLLVIVVVSHRNGEGIAWLWDVGAVPLGMIMSALPMRWNRVQAFAAGVKLSDSERWLIYGLLIFPAILTVYALLVILLEGRAAPVIWVLIVNGLACGKYIADFWQTRHVSR